MTFFILNLSLDFSANLVELRIEKVLTYTLNQILKRRKRELTTYMVAKKQVTTTYRQLKFQIEKTKELKLCFSGNFVLVDLELK